MLTIKALIIGGIVNRGQGLRSIFKGVDPRPHLPQLDDKNLLYIKSRSPGSQRLKKICNKLSREEQQEGPPVMKDSDTTGGVSLPGVKEEFKTRQPKRSIPFHIVECQGTRKGHRLENVPTPLTHLYCNIRSPQPVTHRTYGRVYWACQTIFQSPRACGLCVRHTRDYEKKQAALIGGRPPVGGYIKTPGYGGYNEYRFWFKILQKKIANHQVFPQLHRVGKLSRKERLGFIRINCYWTEMILQQIELRFA